MPPGVANPGNHAPLVAAATYTENVVIDEATPLVSVVVYNDSEQKEAIHPVCRDLPFAIIFAVHAAVILWLGIFTAPKGFDQLQFNATSIEEEIRKGDDVTDEDLQEFKQFVTAAIEYVQVYPLRIVLYVVIPCCLLAYVFGAISTAFVIKPCPHVVVYGCLISSVAMVTMLMSMSAIASGSTFVYGLTILAIGASIYYVSVVWKTVPFAAVNLKIAVEALGRNSGMYFVAFCFAELGFAWILSHNKATGVKGTSAFQNHKCTLEHPNSNFDMGSDDYNSVCDPPGLNTVQVTVAGVMATWCFDKTEADGCCSRAIHGSAIVSVFRYLVESARNQRARDDDSVCGAMLLCILECLARLLEDILEYFNQWAYVFVGVYGYSYLESGRRVMELFRAKGFTSIITNSLVGYVLGFTQFAVALLTGAAGVALEALITNGHSGYIEDGESYVFGPLPAAPLAFGVSFVVGLWIASVMMNVLKGAVNTLIVCWADNPAVMEIQHPTLMKEMTDAWSGVFSSIPSVGGPADVPDFGCATAGRIRVASGRFDSRRPRNEDNSSHMQGADGASTAWVEIPPIKTFVDDDECVDGEVVETG
eukprot:scaffold15034_cov181-Amphora_coffeaeformis.AAC.7